MPGVCARHSSHQSPVLPRHNTPLSHHCGDTGRWPGQGSLIWDMTEASFVSPPGPGLGWAIVIQISILIPPSSPAAGL